jgi:predicted RNA-binding protein with RPS1 domain
VNHPSEVLAIGQRVEVKVVDIDRDRQRVSLSLKETQEDPWRRVLSAYHVGDELEGAVTKVLAFGAFVEILEGVEGLLHISELAQEHVENPREIVQPGDEVRVKILEIDAERRRLSLSTKRVEGQVLPLRGAVAADAIVVDEAFVLGDRSIPLVAADDPPEAEPRMDAAAFSRNVFDATWLARFEASQGVVATRLTQEARQWRQLGQAVGYFPGEPSETEWDEVGFQDALVEAQADLTDERVRFLLLLFDASEATWAGAVTAIEQLIAHARDGELTPADYRPADWCLYGMDTTITTAGTPADWRGEQLQAPRLPAARALHTELVAALQGALIVT